MLIRFSCLLLLSGLVFAATSVRAQLADETLESTLKKARWRQRVLLVCAPAAPDARLLRQRELLRAARPGLAERDLLVRELVLPELTAADRQHLRRLGVAADEFQVLLIGKDGGVKRRESRPVAPEVLFGTIDQMPMRRQEMRGQQ